MQGGSLIFPHDYYYCFDYNNSLMLRGDEEAAASSNLLNYESPVSDRMLLPQMSEIDMPPNLIPSHYFTHNINHVFQPEQLYNPMPAPLNWDLKVEEGDHEVKVGRYSVEERKDRIVRYLKKRGRRNFNKTIKYACRKTLADKRVRVRGRFAKNSTSTEASQSQSQSEEEEEEEENDVFMIKSTSTSPHQYFSTNYQHTIDITTSSFHDQQSSSSSLFQMIKYDEDDWFQAAMDNIGNLAYL